MTRIFLCTHIGQIIINLAIYLYGYYEDTMKCIVEITNQVIIAKFEYK